MPVLRPPASQPSRLRSSALGLLLPIILLMVSGVTHASVADFKVLGVSGSLKKNIEIFLESVPEPQNGDLKGYREQLHKNTLQALQAFGYYQPGIKIQIAENGTPPSATINISPGQPVLITQLKLQLQGEAQQDDEFEKLRQQMPLQVGDPFHHGKYEDLKNLFSELAVSRGYFDAQWQTANVEISVNKKSAKIELIFVSGVRYRYGDTSITGTEKLHDLILATRTFQAGEFYSVAKIADYNAKLNDTKFFRSVLIRPELDNRAEGFVPITIQAIPFARNIVSVGGGYSTDVGPRGTLKWTVPRINNQGHSLISALEISAPEQNAIVSYKIPIEDAHKNFGVLQTGYQRRENADTESRKFTLQAKRQRNFFRDWEGAYLLRYEREDFIQGQQSDVSSLIIPGVSLSRERRLGGLNVHWGDMQLFYLDVSDPVWGSDTRFAKIYGRSKWVRSTGGRKQHKYIARVDLGAIAVESISKIPASLRFFTGGDQTIRGFDYETIAPRDDSGQLIGGRYLAVGSLEYGYLFLEKWRLAGFVDIGTATNDFSEPVSVGSGIGLRWITPVGPLRIDFAYALSEPGKPWRIHFSMGPDI